MTQSCGDRYNVAGPRQRKVTMEEAEHRRGKSEFNCRREEGSTQVPRSRQKWGRPE